MSVLAPVLFADEECSDQRACAVGFFIGLGVASKVTLFPLLLLMLLLKRPRPILIALAAGSLSLFAFLLPIIDELESVFIWLFSIASHEGRYGEGDRGFHRLGSDS